MNINKIVNILILLFATVALSSCLGEPDDIEVTSTTLIKSFALGADVTVYTSNMVKNSDGQLVEVKDTTTYSADSVKFTIDQITRTIYNRDSLPVGSDLTKMPVTMYSAGAYAMRITTDAQGNDVDTVWTATDSLNLTKPVRFKVYAADETTTRIYTLKVNVHKVDPDSLVWNRYATSFSTGEVTGAQRTVVLNDNIITYASSGDQTYAYVNSWKSPAASWDRQQLTGISQANVLSAYVYDGQVYMTTADGRIMTSEDGISWQATTLDGNIRTIVGVVTCNNKPRMIAITEDNGTKTFRVTEDGATWLTQTATVPQGFPVDNFKGFEQRLSTNKQQYRLTVMGQEDTENALNDSLSYSWFTYDGIEWTDMVGATVLHLPKMTNPTYMYYNGQTIGFGYGPEEHFNTFYWSEEYGLVWKKKTRKMMLPYDFEGRTEYSSVLTPDNYIWIMWSKTDKNSDEVWRGRVNKLGFAAN